MSTEPRRRLIPVALAAVVLAGPAAATPPMSAIDWLSKSVMAAPGVPEVSAPVGIPPAEGIDVQTLGLQQLDATGLVTAEASGLPADLWVASRTGDLVELLQAEPQHLLPALQDLLDTLLLVEARPPADSGASGGFLLARVDRLLEQGALDPAAALLQQAGVHQPALFRRWFDVELLLGQEQAACKSMAETPEIAPTLPARIFCLARTGDWGAAALTLQSAKALGMLQPENAAVLTRFLDTGGDDSATPLPPPAHPTPLVWRMMEAVGEPLPTNTLPLAFAQADLRANTGWKAQVVAAERLARAGAIPANQLIGVYSQGRPSASGDPWDRVAAVQALDRAVTARDAAAVSRALPPAWTAMSAAGLQVTLARLYGKAVAGMKLGGNAAEIAFRLALLAPDAATLAGNRVAANPTEAFLIGLARGQTTGLTPPDDMGSAIMAGFAPGARPSEDVQAMLDAHRTGEAILHAINRIADGAQGDLRGVTEGIATLHAAGLDEAARKIAIQLMLVARAG